MKRFFLFFSLVCIAIGCTVDEQPVTPVQEDEIHPLDKAYVYEAFESKETWKSFNSLEERMAACQVPEAIAQQLSTEALIEVCLDHPFASMCFTSQNALDYLVKGLGRNNAFLQLFSRENACEQLINYYASHPDLSFGKRYCLELLIGSGLFPGVYSEPLVSKLKTVIEEQLSIKNSDPNRFSAHSLIPETLIMEELKADKGQSYNMALSLYADLEKKSLLQTKSMLIVYTALGSSFYGITTSEYSASERAYIDTLYSQLFPNATLVSSTSATYDCHDYAWTTPLSGEVCWVTDPSPYINDSTYIPVNNYYADVIYDSGADFSGIPTATSNVVISKWPNGPVMQHSLNDSPYGTLSSPTYYSLNTGAIRGAICGEDTPYCHTQYTYWYSLGGLGGAPGSYYTWEVSSLHDFPTDYSLSIPVSGGNVMYLIYNVTGEFTIVCNYYAYGSLFATQSIMLEPDLMNIEEVVLPPDEEQ